MKISKIERCNYCCYFKFRPGDYLERNRFKCSNPDTVRGNGNFRIINRKTAMNGKFPTWCGLEDYDIFKKNNSI